MNKMQGFAATAWQVVLAVWQWLKNWIVDSLMTTLNLAFVVGIVYISVGHTYNLMVKQGLHDTAAIVAVAVWEGVWLYCSYVIDRSHNHPKPAWAAWAGFVMGFVLVEISNYQGMAKTLIGSGIAIATPALLLVMKFVLKYQIEQRKYRPPTTSTNDDQPVISQPKQPAEVNQASTTTKDDQPKLVEVVEIDKRQESVNQVTENSIQKVEENDQEQVRSDQTKQDKDQMTEENSREMVEETADTVDDTGSTNENRPTERTTQPNKDDSRPKGKRKQLGEKNPQPKQKKTQPLTKDNQPTKDDTRPSNVTFIDPDMVARQIAKNHFRKTEKWLSRRKLAELVQEKLGVPYTPYRAETKILTPLKEEQKQNVIKKKSAM